MFDFTRWAVGWRSRRQAQPTLSSGRELFDPVLGCADSGAPITWPTPALERAGHLVCLAGSGAGKTMLIANGLLQEIRGAGGPAPLANLVIDPKGDLIAALLAGLAATAPGRLADVRYLDPFGAGGFPFNLNYLPLGKTPLDIRAVQLANLVAEVSTATGAQKHLGVGARQLDVLQHVILGALACPHEAANILWALDALLLPKGLKLLGTLTTSERAKQFLATADLGDELRVSCASRLRAALAATDSLERLVSSKGCIQFEEILAPGRLCLVDLGRPVGGLTSLQAFYANLLARLAIEHLMERPSRFPGHHCRIVVDECQIVAPVLADRAEAVLTTGRSRALSLTVISQGTTLIHAASDTLLRVLMTNTPTKFIGRLSAPDAELLAKEQAPSRGVDDKLSTMRGRFVATVTNLRDREFFRLQPGCRERFATAEVDTAAWAAAAEIQAVEIAAAKDRLALPPSTSRRVTLAAVSGARPPRAQRSRSRPAPSVATVPPTGTATVANGEPAGQGAPVPPPRPRSRWG